MPLRVVEECCDFLGVSRDESWLPEPARLNPGDNKQAESPVLWRARRIPGWRQLATWIPISLKKTVKEKMVSSVATPSVWSAEAIDQLKRIYLEESLPILRRAGKTEDFWQRPETLR